MTEIRADEVLYADGSTRAYDHLIAFPPYVAAVRWPDLRADQRGFLATDPVTRQLIGHTQIYAPGDAGDFPVKQAFLALLQADTVAEHIASLVLGQHFATPFDPVSMCVMESSTRRPSRRCRCEVTGDPAHPVRVRPDADGAYKVGVSPLWRLGKKLLGLYLPMRFAAGEPFHAGHGWQMMDIGLRGMSGVLAD